jgi:hypothetical protein
MEVEAGIDVKEAVRISLEYIKKLYENQESLRDLRLEEVELIEDEGPDPFWLVTLSFTRPTPEPVSALAQIVAPQGNKYYRVYKTFHIDAISGKVKAMKIRET